jgi:hypothetical protein
MAAFAGERLKMSLFKGQLGMNDIGVVTTAATGGFVPVIGPFHIILGGFNPAGIPFKMIEHHLVFSTNSGIVGGEMTGSTVHLATEMDVPGIIQTFLVLQVQPGPGEGLGGDNYSPGQSQIIGVGGKQICRENQRIPAIGNQAVTLGAVPQPWCLKSLTQRQVHRKLRVRIQMACQAVGLKSLIEMGVPQIDVMGIVTGLTGLESRKNLCTRGQRVSLFIQKREGGMNLILGQEMGEGQQQEYSHKNQQ